MALGPLLSRERIIGRHARVMGAPPFCAPGAPRSNPAIGDAGEEVVGGVDEAGVALGGLAAGEVANRGAGSAWSANAWTSARGSPASIMWVIRDARMTCGVTSRPCSTARLPRQGKIQSTANLSVARPCSSASSGPLTRVISRDMMRIALGRRADGKSVTSIARGLTHKTAGGQERTVSRRALYNAFRAHDAEQAAGTA
jgi:hypothetical protein